MIKTASINISSLEKIVNDKWLPVQNFATTDILEEVFNLSVTKEPFCWLDFIAFGY
ncbi:hypothetical protein NECAME_04460, partial [Necator americanus]